MSHNSKIYPKSRYALFFLALIFLGISLTGCVTLPDYESSQEYNSDAIGRLDSSVRLGQTFVSRRPNLNGITIWITVPTDSETGLLAPQNNPITIKLYPSVEVSSPLYVTTILAPTTGNNVPVYIAIPKQNNPAGQGYFLEISKNTGSVVINGRSEDAYPDGQTYMNGQPLSADIAFRLSYDYDLAAFTQDIAQSLQSVWLAVPLLVLLLIPGWLLLALTGLSGRYDFGERLALSIGISLAFVPLLMLWTTIVGIHWTQLGVLFCAGLLLIVWFIRTVVMYFLHRRRKTTNEVNFANVQKSDIKAGSVAIGSSVALTIIFMGTLAIRLIMVRDLATPAWVDSVHHALITRLIMIGGAYPSSYLPYWDFNPTAYHPGFHSIVAAFTWLTNLELDRSLLILGQVLNALIIFPVYLLAKKLTDQSSVGIIAALITGFITPMPAYYTSWGRYTELAGLIVLPAAFTLVLETFFAEKTRQCYWLFLLAGIASGGLFLVHYRVILFLGCLILAYLVVYLIRNKQAPFNYPWRVVVKLCLLTVASILLVSPWLFQTVKNTVLPLISTLSSNPVPFFQDFSWAYLYAALGKQALILATLGIVWGVIKRLRFPILIIIWVIFLFLFANLTALHLPGGSLVNNTSVEIMLFMPMSVLGGYFFAQLARSWKEVLPKYLSIPFIVIVIIILGWTASVGARQLITILNPTTILTRQSDLPAIQWINENIPENETIVINPFPWGYGLYAGNDGGYWISPLTGRFTLPPPVLYGMDTDREKINQLSQKLIELAANPPALKDFMVNNKLHYIYVGARGGVLSPQKLTDSSLYTIRYHAAGVWIFELKP